jgi:chemotaxis methyl-accepting protein methylase
VSKRQTATTGKSGKGQSPAAHLKRHWFRPGTSGNPAGRRTGQRNAATLLREAIERAEADDRFDLYDFIVRQARRNNSVLIAVMNKLLPNKTELSFGAEEFEATQALVVDIIAKHVKDPTVLERIANELDAVSSGEEGANLSS